MARVGFEHYYFSMALEKIIPCYLSRYLFANPPQLECHKEILTAVPQYEMIIPQAAPLLEISTGHRKAGQRRAP
jgi:hypothetical protein